MKKILPLVITLFLSGAFLISCAQDKEKKEVKKEIQVEKENGNTTVTITETKDGTVTKKVLTGEEAEQFLDEQHGSGHNEFYFSSDEDGDGERIVIVKEFDGNGEGEHMVWVSEDGEDMHFNMEMRTDQIAEEIKELQEEIEKLNKEEISERIDEILKNHEELEREMEIKMETIHEDMGNVKVNVEEVDGVITIEKTVDGKTTVKTIELDSDGGSGKNVYIIKTSVDDDDDGEKSLSGHTSNMNLNVYPNPNGGSFTIEMDLESDKEATVTVVDSKGSEVYNKVVKGGQEHKLNVKVKNAESGMYIVTVKQGNEIMKLKTMIE